MSAADSRLTGVSCAGSIDMDGLQTSRQGLRIEVITPRQVWDVIPAAAAEPSALSVMQLHASLQSVSAGVVQNRVLSVDRSPVTYPAPAAGPAYRVTAVNAATGAPATVDVSSVLTVRLTYAGDV